MNSFVVGSDKQFFTSLSAWEQRRFFMDCTRFFAEKYGEENIISAIVHTDETTPHLHLNLMPIVNGKLCSKDLFDKVKLSQLQTELYEKVGKKWCLRRGKEGSQRKHLSTEEYKAQKIVENAVMNASEINERSREQEQRSKQEMEALSKQKEELTHEVEELTGLHSAVKSAANEQIPTFGKKEIISTLRAENAKLNHELEIKKKDSSSLFAQLQQADKKAQLNETAYKMVEEMIKAYPDEFDALLKKSRTKSRYSPTPIHGNGNGKDGK